MYLAAATVALGTALGILVALLQMSRFRPAHALAQTYTEILRGTPILLQLYFFWIGLPKLFPVALSDFACILIALVVNSSSYIAEIIRAGVGAVDAGQWEAARSVGLSEAHVLARVILPPGGEKHFTGPGKPVYSNGEGDVSGVGILCGRAHDQL